MTSEIKPEKLFPIIVVALLLMASLSNVSAVDSSGSIATVSDLVGQTNEDFFGESNITVNAFENVTLVPSNNSVDLGSFSQIEPTALSLEIVNGFEPTDRFNSPYSYSLGRESNSANFSLTTIDDGLRVFFNTEDNYQPSISLYNMSFLNSVNVSRSDFLSLAITAESDFNSSDGYVGLALSLRDLQGSRHYVFIHISNTFYTDKYELSPYFLGWSYGKEYPQYSFRYNNSSGPWFVQLALNQSFSALDLSSAWLDGLLIGGELFSVPLPYSTMQFNARFNYVLIHSQSFSINQKMVNSTVMTLPPTTNLNIRGISCERLNAIITGPLTPSYEKEEELENKTVKTIDVFYNITQLLFYNFSEVSVRKVGVEGRVNITVLSKTVRKCTVTINNVTDEDLTPALLRSDNGIIHRSDFSDLHSLRVFLVLYRFNAWMLSSGSTTVRFPTKSGIIEEYFVPERNESVVVINPNETSLREISIYVGAGNFNSGDFSVNDSKKPLSSLAVLNNAVFLAASFKFEEQVSPYTVKCSFHSDPLYHHSTVQPLMVFLDNALFKIYTPLNVEAQPRMQIPLTLSVRTSSTLATNKTYTIKMEYDSSMLEVDNDELMINKLVGYEYFMIKPIGSGPTEFTIHFIGQSIEDSDASIPFLVSMNYSLYPQIIPYLVFIVTVLSVLYVICGKNLADWLSHRNNGNKSARAKEKTSKKRGATRASSCLFIQFQLIYGIEKMS